MIVLIATLKKLKDSLGNYILPVTHSDAVHVNSSGKTLTQKLLEIDSIPTTPSNPSNPPTNSTYLTGKKINVIGDSIVAGDNNGAEKWTTYLSANYGCTVRNYGVSGSTLMNNGTSWGSVFRYKNMDADADIILVWAGWNDINQNLTLGAFADRVDTTFYGALHLMADGLQTKYVGKLIYYCTIMDFHHTWDTVQNFNKAVREVAEYWGIPVIEMASVGFSSRNVATKTALMPDNTHPNTQGNIIVARKFAKHLS